MAISELSYYLPEGVSIETARSRYIEALRKAHGGKIPRNLDPGQTKGRAYYAKDQALQDLLYRLPPDARLVVWSVPEIKNPALVLSALKSRASEKISIETLEPYHHHTPAYDGGLTVLEALSMFTPEHKTGDSRFVRKHSDETIRMIRAAKERGRPAQDIIGQFKVSRSYYYRVTKDIPTLEKFTPFEEPKPAVAEVEESVRTLGLDARSTSALTGFLLKFESKSTRQIYLSDVKKFLTYTRLRREVTALKDIDDTDALSYQSHVRESVSPRSQNRYLSALRSLYRHLEKKKHVPENPFDDISLPRIDAKRIVTERLTMDEVTAILREAQKIRDQEKVTWKRAKHHRNQVILRTLSTCGMRIGALLKVKLSDIKRVDGLIHLSLHSKAQSHKYTIPLDEDTTRVIEDFIKAYHAASLPDHYLFFESMGRAHRPCTHKSIHRALKTIIKTLGFSQTLTHHSFRVFSAVEWYKAQMSLREIQLRLDHSSIDQTVAYISIAIGIPPEEFLSKIREAM